MSRLGKAHFRATEKFKYRLNSSRPTQAKIFVSRVTKNVTKIVPQNYDTFLVRPSVATSVDTKCVTI